MATKSAAGYTYGLRLDDPGDPGTGFNYGKIKLATPQNYVANFGMGGDAGAGGGIGDIAGAFDEAYSKGAGEYGPFAGDHSKIDQLQSLYGGVGDAYDVTDTLSALGATRKNNLLAGEQAASTAANKFTETSLPGNNSAVGASMLRAQALLPFLQADTAAAGEERKYADSAKQQALGAAADIATKLAQLEQDYTNSLASYNSDKAKAGLGYAGTKIGTQVEAQKTGQSAALDVLRFQMQQQQFAQEMALRNRQANQQQNEQVIRAKTAATPKPTSEFYYTDNLGQRLQGSPAW